MDADGLVVLQSKKLLTNHKGDFTFKPGGLIKKTISIKVGGHPHHLICYYNKQDFCYAHLGQGKGGKVDVSPFNGELLAEVRRVKVPDELLSQQSFRKPVVMNHEENEDASVAFNFDPNIASSILPVEPSKGKKRRGSFPGALPASRTKRDQSGNDPFYFVPIAPAQDFSTPGLEGPFIPFQANLQAIPESSNSLGGLEMMAGLYQPETPTKNSFKDDLAAMSSLYPTPPYSNGNGVSTEPIGVDDLKEGLKWSNWFNSPEQAQFKANQELFGHSPASPVLREDPMLAPIRPPSALFGLEDLPKSCD